MACPPKSLSVSIFGTGTIPVDPTALDSKLSYTRIPHTTTLLVTRTCLILSTKLPAFPVGLIIPHLLICAYLASMYAVGGGLISRLVIS
jgi:hypothetical protein